MGQKEGEVTRILQEIESGDAEAAERLFPLVYDELRALAGKYVGQAPNHTLQPTALVHELFVRLAKKEKIAGNSRTHFMAIAAKAMRRLLINHARDKAAAKRGGEWQRMSFDEAALTSGEGRRGVDLIDLDKALTRLAELSERQARVIELRAFGGLTTAETADYLEVSERTVEADWRMAKAWLSRELS